MLTAVYLRKSRAEELSDTVGETLSRHKETLLAFAKKNGLTVSEIYEEVISGESLFARPQMLRLLKGVEQNQYDAVLCMDIDRLGRGTMSDQGMILETLKAAGTRIITPRKTYDLNNDMDETYSEFESFMARQELKTIKRRLQRGLKKTISDGGYVANAPFGYEKAVIDKLPTLAVVEEEARFVRMMFDLYADKGMGCQAIADTINSYGIKPRRGDRFSRTSVRFILQNPVYIGKIVWDRKTHLHKNTGESQKQVTLYNPREKWSVTEGRHPAIVEKAVFDRCQEIFKTRRHAPSNTGAAKNPLAGLVRCKNCGGMMQRIAYKDHRKTDTLYCTTPGCMRSTRLDCVEQAVIDSLSETLTKIKITGTEESEKKKEEELSSLKQSVIKELRQTQKQKNNLHDLLEREVYTAEVFSERSRLLEEKTLLLRGAIEELSGQIRKIQCQTASKSEKKTESVLEAYRFADTNQKNQLLKTMISSIEYYKAPGWKPRQFELVLHIRGIKLYPEQSSSLQES